MPEIYHLLSRITRTSLKEIFILHIILNPSISIDLTLVYFLGIFEVLLTRPLLLNFEYFLFDFVLDGITFFNLSFGFGFTFVFWRFVFQFGCIGTFLRSSFLFLQRKITKFQNLDPFYLVEYITNLLGMGCTGMKRLLVLESSLSISWASFFFLNGSIGSE
jgi:hypothetical protein